MDLDKFLKEGNVSINPKYNPKTKEGKIQPKYITNYMPNGSILDRAKADAAGYSAGMSYNLNEFNDTNYEEYGVIPTRARSIESLNRERAEHQSAAEQVGNMLVQAGLNEVLLGTLQGFADIGNALYEGARNLGDYAYNAAKEGTWDPKTDNYHPDYNNPISEYFEQQKEAVRKAFEIYQKDPNESFAFGDLGWWMNGTVDAFTTVSLMLPAMGVGKAVSLAGKAMRLNKLARGISKTTRAVSKAHGLTPGQVQAWSKYGIEGLTSRVAENSQEARETYKAVYDDILQRLNDADNQIDTNDANKIDKKKFLEQHPEYQGLDNKEIAARLASAGAGETFRKDMWLLLMDIPQFAAYGSMSSRLKKGFNNAKLNRLNRESIANIGKTAAEHSAAVNVELEKKGFNIWGKDFIKDVMKHPFSSIELLELGEGVEEGWQGIQQERGKETAELILNPNFTRRSASSYLTDGKIWEQAWWGAFGGVLFQNVRKGGYYLKEKYDINKKIEKFKKDHPNHTDKELEDYTRQLKRNSIFDKVERLNGRNKRVNELNRQMAILNGGYNPMEGKYKFDEFTGEFVELDKTEDIEKEKSRKLTDKEKTIWSNHLLNEFKNDLILDEADAGMMELTMDFLKSNEFMNYIDGLHTNVDGKTFSADILENINETYNTYADILNQVEQVAEENYDDVNPAIIALTARNIFRNQEDINRIKPLIEEGKSRISAISDSVNRSAVDHEYRLQRAKVANGRLKELSKYLTQLEDDYQNKKITKHQYELLKEEIENDIRATVLFSNSAKPNVKDDIENTIYLNSQRYNNGESVDERFKRISVQDLISRHVDYLHNVENEKRTVINGTDTTFEDYVKVKPEDKTLAAKIANLGLEYATKQVSIPKTNRELKQAFDEISYQHDVGMILKFQEALSRIKDYINTAQDVDEAVNNILQGNAREIKDILDRTELDYQDVEELSKYAQEVKNKRNNTSSTVVNGRIQTGTTTTVNTASNVGTSTNTTTNTATGIAASTTPITTIPDYMNKEHRKIFFNRSLKKDLAEDEKLAAHIHIRKLIKYLETGDLDSYINDPNMKQIAAVMSEHNDEGVVIDEQSGANRLQELKDKYTEQDTSSTGDWSVDDSDLEPAEYVQGPTQQQATDPKKSLESAFLSGNLARRTLIDAAHNQSIYNLLLSGKDINNPKVKEFLNKFITEYFKENNIEDTNENRTEYLQYIIDNNYFINSPVWEAYKRRFDKNKRNASSFTTNLGFAWLDAYIEDKHIKSSSIYKNEEKYYIDGVQLLNYLVYDKNFNVDQIKYILNHVIEDLKQNTIGKYLFHNNKDLFNSISNNTLSEYIDELKTKVSEGTNKNYFHIGEIYETDPKAKEKIRRAKQFVYEGGDIHFKVNKDQSGRPVALQVYVKLPSENGQYELVKIGYLETVDELTFDENGKKVKSARMDFIRHWSDIYYDSQGISHKKEGIWRISNTRLRKNTDGSISFIGMNKNDYTFDNFIHDLIYGNSNFDERHNNDIKTLFKFLFDYANQDAFGGVDSNWKNEYFAMIKNNVIFKELYDAGYFPENVEDTDANFLKSLKSMLFFEGIYNTSDSTSRDKLMASYNSWKESLFNNMEQTYNIEQALDYNAPGSEENWYTVNNTKLNNANERLHFTDNEHLVDIGGEEFSGEHLESLQTFENINGTYKLEDGSTIEGVNIGNGNSAHYMGYIIRRKGTRNKPMVAIFRQANKLNRRYNKYARKELELLFDKYHNKEISFNDLYAHLKDLISDQGGLFGGVSIYYNNEADGKSANIKICDEVSGLVYATIYESSIENRRKIASTNISYTTQTVAITSVNGVEGQEIVNRHIKAGNTNKKFLKDVQLEAIRNIVDNLFFNNCNFMQRTEDKQRNNKYLKKVNGKFVINIAETTEEYSSFGEFALKNNAFKTNVAFNKQTGSYFTEDNNESFDGFYINVQSTASVSKDATQKKPLDTVKDKLRNLKRVNGKSSTGLNISELIKIMYFGDKGVSDILSNYVNGFTQIFPEEIYYDDENNDRLAYYENDKIYLTRKALEVINDDQRDTTLRRILLHENIHKQFARHLQRNLARREVIFKELKELYYEFDEALGDSVNKNGALSREVQQINNFIEQEAKHGYIFKLNEFVENELNNYLRTHDLTDEEKDAKRKEYEEYFLEEFLVESFTQDAFIRFLGNVKSKRNNKKGKESMLQRIINAILEIFGLKSKINNNINSIFAQEQAILSEDFIAHDENQTSTPTTTTEPGTSTAPRRRRRSFASDTTTVIREDNSKYDGMNNEEIELESAFGDNYNYYGNIQVASLADFLNRYDNKRKPILATLFEQDRLKLVCR